LCEEAEGEEKEIDGTVAARWTNWRVLLLIPSTKSVRCFAREGLNTRHLPHQNL